MSVLQGAYDALKRPALGLLTLFSFADAFGVNLAQLNFSVAYSPAINFLVSRRPFTLALGIMAAYFLLVHYKHRGIPLAVTKFENELIFETAHGDRVLLSETCELRANHDNVEGYYQELRSDGTMPENSLEFTVSHAQSSLVKSGNERAWEIFHQFDKPLPAPIWTLKLRKVQRTARVLHLNAFTRNEDWFEVRTPRYPRENLTLIINFHADNPPIKARCQAVTITPDHAIIPLPVEWLGLTVDGRERMKVFIRRSFNQRHRLIWCLRGNAAR